MTLSGLSATELARIDSVCLDFESQLREGQQPSIDEIVDYHGGTNAELLRQELGSIQQELLMESTEGNELFHSKGSNHSIGSTQGNTPQGTFATIAPFGTGLPSSSNRSSLSPPTPGTLLGPYQVERQIGQGGMGVVFSARDHRLGRKVAIKVLSTTIAGRSNLVERFDREARAVAAISHPHIVELFDVGSYEGLPYAVMEFLDGITLEDYLGEVSLQPAQVRRFGSQIAEALATAHAAGVIHRDLKPQNIMLVGGDATGRDSSISTTRTSSIDQSITKLFDFGLSRVEPMAVDDGDDSDQDDGRTSEGLIMGTPGYMAPEQATGETVTSSADLFSLGCILHEAFYGERAFEGRTKSQRIAAALSDMPVSDSIKRAEDPELADLIDDCLQKRPELRPASAAEIADRLRNDSSVGLGMVGHGGARQQISRRGWIALAASGAALTLGGGAVGTWLSMQSRQQLHAIKSLAVLSFEDQTGTDHRGEDHGELGHLEPVGLSPLSPGESLPGLLVHELTRVSDLIVPSFRPAKASSPSEFRELGAKMEVDAMLTGTVRPMATTVRGKLMWDLDLQLISSETGTQIWGNRLRTVAGEHLFAQGEAAAEIAAVIGRQLTAAANGDSPPNEQAYHCLVEGGIRSDPDSCCGLEQALKCFTKANEFDATHVEPIAGIALTSITLAAQSPPAKAIELASRSRQRSSEALGLDVTSVDARLAKLMDDWQMLGRYEKTDAGFRELIKMSPDRWQIHHQYALFLLATGRSTVAIDHLREASLLSPMSNSIRIDLARAYWFSGDPERAKIDAMRIRSRPGGEYFANGLLIDIHEQDSDFKSAARLDPEFVAGISSLTGDTYWSWRKSRLDAIPYASYGEKVNQLIWNARADEIDNTALADFLEPRTPMLPLALAAHPSLTEAKLLPRSAEMLPPSMV